MTDADDGGQDLDDVIARIHAAALDEFIARRDAAAKELRRARRRADATTVKSLRKPSRMAWALDTASRDEPVAVARLESAASAALVAQTGGGDVRAALRDLRDAVRNVAEAAGRAATGGGFKLDDGDVVQAVMAVIAVPSAFALMRAGQLVDVPEAGGLDFLAGAAPPPVESRATDAKRDDADAAADTSRREAIAWAERTAGAARAEAVAADRALGEAEVKLAEAEAALSAAQQQAVVRRAELARAREAAVTASAAVDAAEKGVAALGGRAGD
jgi:hypothetical protein